MSFRFSLQSGVWTNLLAIKYCQGGGYKSTSFLSSVIRWTKETIVVTMARTPSKSSPPVIIELVESDDDLDLNNNQFEECQLLPQSIGRRWGLIPPGVTDEVKSTRRKSSASRYGFDDAFIDLVAKSCQLVLETENVLGRGSFGTVVAANYQGKEVAAKIVDTKGRRQFESVKNEENALDLTYHPNVVKTMDIFRLGVNGTAVIILPRLRKGNLLSLLNKGLANTASKMVTFAKEIGSALSFCHAHDLLHLDVKPQNVLIDFNNNLCLADFGNSRKISDLHRFSPLTLDGTVAYKAPELFCGNVPSTKADVYSFGITFWQILERETPYFGHNEQTIIYKVVAEGFRPSMLESQDLYTQKIQTLIKCCWEQDPAQRPEMETILAKLQALSN